MTNTLQQIRQSKAQLKKDLQLRIEKFAKENPGVQFRIHITTEFATDQVGRHELVMHTVSVEVVI